MKHLLVKGCDSAVPDSFVLIFQTVFYIDLLLRLRKCR